MTPTGAARARYRAEHPEDVPPSRFTPDGAYSAWSARADRWAALKNAARESITIPLETDGRRNDDPLVRLIPGDGRAEPGTVALVESITGRLVVGVNLAPACRAALRRWAARA